jgi:hypothetical protein
MDGQSHLFLLLYGGAGWLMFVWLPDATSALWLRTHEGELQYKIPPFIDPESELYARLHELREAERRAYRRSGKSIGIIVMVIAYGAGAWLLVHLGF